MSTVSATIIAAVLYRLRRSSEPLPSYERLRTALVERYQSHPDLITDLNEVEHRPSAVRSQADLEASLEASGASADAIILSLEGDVLAELQQVAGGPDVLTELALALAQSEQARERLRRAGRRQSEQQPQPEEPQPQPEEWSQWPEGAARQREARPEELQRQQEDLQRWQEELQRQQEDLQRRQEEFQRQQRSYDWLSETDRPTPAEGSLPGRINLPPPVPPKPPTSGDEQEG
jgi:hypothetical protein